MVHSSQRQINKKIWVSAKLKGIQVIMGTPSLITFKKNGKVYVQIYHQYDGYPEHNGLNLAKFLDNIRLTNGFTCEDMTNTANGIGCLAAQYIANEKSGIGGVYIADGNEYVDWNYTVRVDENSIFVKVGCMEEMTAKEFLAYCNAPADQLEKGSITTAEFRDWLTLSPSAKPN